MTMYQNENIIYKERVYISLGNDKQKLVNCLVISKNEGISRFFEVGLKVYKSVNVEDKTRKDTLFQIENDKEIKRLIKNINEAGNFPDKLKARKALSEFQRSYFERENKFLKGVQS